MAERSLTKTLTEAARAAVQASDWERDRKAWNLPRAKDRTVPHAADQGQPGAGEGPAQPGAEPPATPPETK